MTRYTKLEGRKKEFLPSANPFGGRSASEEEPDVQPASTASHAPASHETPAASSAPESTSEPKPDQQQSKDEDKENSEDSSDKSDLAKLQKRMKLLKLKAKKAKTPEKRKELTRELRQLGSQVAALEASNSSGQKRKRDDGDNKSNKRKYTQEERSEYRRQKRMEERQANLRCFACRAQGHSAKDCPNALNASSNALESETPTHEGLTGKNVVGICFRCGSKEHTLAQCTLPGGGKGAARGGKNLPFATCFVCGQKGHLSLACEQNKNRGVYPNGGSCRLCQSVEHLVRDCPLREQQSVVDPKLGAAIAGQQAPVGADEDDFHAFSRVRKQVDSQETQEQQAAKNLARRRVAPAPPAKKPPTKKVVTF